MTSTNTPSEARFRNLRIWNGAMGALHAVQAVLVLVLANDFALPVTATFLNDAPGVNAPELTRLFEVRIAWGVAAFLFLSAAAHLDHRFPRRVRLVPQEPAAGPQLRPLDRIRPQLIDHGGAHRPVAGYHRTWPRWEPSSASTPP